MAEKNKNTVVESQEKDEARESEELLGKARKWSKGASDERLKNEVTWYSLQLLKDGDHYVMFPHEEGSSPSGTVHVKVIHRRKGEVRRTYNKFRSILRALKATTTTTDMRWDVPGGDEDEVMGSNYLNHFIDKNRKNPFPEVVGNVVEHGFMRSVGYFDTYWDSELGEPVVVDRDPFDLVMDRHGKYARRTYTMREEDVKNSKSSDGELMFKNTDTLTPTTKLSSSPVYENYLSSKYQRQTSSQEGLSDIMMEEYHILEQDESGEYKVRIITSSEGSDEIHSEETYDDDELRFIEYWPEKRPGDIYNEPWMKDARDPQRSLDNMFSHMEEFIRTMGKGRVMKRKGQFLDRISDKDGQLFEYEGEKPEFMPPTPITNDQFNFQEKVELMMEDSVGIHPSQIRKTETARGIGYLIALDEVNVSEPFKNLKNSLIQVGHRLLKLANRHMMSSQDIFWWQDGNVQKAQVIGENAENKPDNVKTIKNPEALTVDLIPKGPFAALAREERVTALAQAGMIRSPEVIFEVLNVGNVKELLQKEMKFRAENPEQGAMGVQPGGVAPVAPPAQEDATIKDVAAQAVDDLKQQLG